MTAVNIEKLTVDWLKECDALSGYTVAMSVPEKRPDRFITVELAGGASDHFLSNPTLAVQVWETSRWNASDAAMRLVQPALLGMIALPSIGDVSIESVVNDMETEAPYQQRYQIVVRFTVSANA